MYLLAAIFLIVVILFFNWSLVEGAARRLLQRALTKDLGVEVRIARLRLHPFRGLFELRGLTIVGSPAAAGIPSAEPTC